jgi:hypothetical protein
MLKWRDSLIGKKAEDKKILSTLKRQEKGDPLIAKKAGDNNVRHRPGPE